MTKQCDFSSLKLFLHFTDKICSSFISIFQSIIRVKKQFPNCGGPAITSYQYTKIGDVMGDMSQKSVTCDDGPCTCQRMYCECDHIFAKANTQAFEAGKAR